MTPEQRDAIEYQEAEWRETERKAEAFDRIMEELDNYLSMMESSVDRNRNKFSQEFIYDSGYLAAIKRLKNWSNRQQGKGE